MKLREQSPPPVEMTDVYAAAAENSGSDPARFRAVAAEFGRRAAAGALLPAKPMAACHAFGKEREARAVDRIAGGGCFESAGRQVGPGGGENDFDLPAELNPSARRIRRDFRRANRGWPFPILGSRAARAILAEINEEAAEQADESQGSLMPDSAANEAPEFSHCGRIEASPYPIDKILNENPLRRGPQLQLRILPGFPGFRLRAARKILEQLDFGV